MSTCEGEHLNKLPNGNCYMKFVSYYKCGCPSTNFWVVEFTCCGWRCFSHNSFALKFQRVLCLWKARRSKDWLGRKFENMRPLWVLFRYWVFYDVTPGALFLSLERCWCNDSLQTSSCLQCMPALCPVFTDFPCINYDFCCTDSGVPLL